jgi:hypothetical protein
MTCREERRLAMGWMLKMATMVARTEAAIL